MQLPQMELVATNGSCNIQVMGFGLLDKLASVLTPIGLSRNDEMQPSLSNSLPSPLSHAAFLHPLVGLNQSFVGRRRLATIKEDTTLCCMEYDRGKVKKTYGFYYDKDVDATYLRVYLGVDASSTPVYEYGHRIVAWSVFGPPLHGQEVMHICHNPRCLSPFHLKYGSHAENMGEVAARKRGRKH